MPVINFPWGRILNRTNYDHRRHHHACTTGVPTFNGQWKFIDGRFSYEQRPHHIDRSEDNKAFCTVVLMENGRECGEVWGSFWAWFELVVNRDIAKIPHKVAMPRSERKSGLAWWLLPAKCCCNNSTKECSLIEKFDIVQSLRPGRQHPSRKMTEASNDETLKLQTYKNELTTQRKTW